MTTRRAWDACLLLVGLLTAYALWGTASVPFHPDESTYLFQGQDLAGLLHDPLALAWRSYADDNVPEAQIDLSLHYRLVDAPLARYQLGLAALLSGQPLPTHDWDWSLTWAENAAHGALPAPGTLLAGRLASTALLPVALLLLCWIGHRLQGHSLALTTVLLYGLNALVLLHTRRAMGEAALAAGVCAALASFLVGHKHPWLAGIGLALAINAKHSALPLLPVGLLAVLWQPGETLSGWRQAWKTKLWAATQYILVVALISLALNPVMWRAPLSAAQAMLARRQALVARQIAETRIIAPQAILNTPSQRLIALAVNLYVTSPSYHEFGNYTQETADSEAAYAQVPGHNLLRGLGGGAIGLTLSINGQLLALLYLRRASPIRRRAICLLLLSGLALLCGLVALVQLPWQRYVLPLVPLSVLWQSYALASYGRAMWAHFPGK